MRFCHSATLSSPLPIYASKGRGVEGGDKTENTTQNPRPGLEPGTFAPEAIALTTPSHRYIRANLVNITSVNTLLNK